MADIYVKFPRCPAGRIRGDIDYELENLVKGWGTVSGGGAGLKDPGFHVDLELDTEDMDTVDRFLELLLQYLRSLPAPEGTELVVIVDNVETARRMSIY